MSQSKSLAKATPTVPRTYVNLPAAPCIDVSSLEATEVVIGTGCFGSCMQFTYKDMFTVCMKQIHKSDVSLQAVRSEAAILFELNSSKCTPHCFGFCPERLGIVMSYINVAGKPVSLWSLLYESKNVDIPLSSSLCTNILKDVCSGLHFIHHKGFLHNDLKLDNIVIGSTLTQNMRPYIIDFGKACPIDNVKRYSLSEAQKELYKKDHPHIAPDLRDGLVTQSSSTDIYSLGRILKRCNARVLHNSDLSSAIKSALTYHSKDRINVNKLSCILSDSTV